MSFIRIRTIKGKQYRYLEERYREGGKVRSKSIRLQQHQLAIEGLARRKVFEVRQFVQHVVWQHALAVDDDYRSFAAIPSLKPLGKSGRLLSHHRRVIGVTPKISHISLVV